MTALPPYSLHPFFSPPAHNNCILDFFDDGSNQLKLRDHSAKLTFDEHGNFTYKVDVSGFDPNELKVDVKGDDIIVVGEHKSNTHHEAVQRSFSRCVRIPKGIHKESIECHVNQKGHLIIEGKKVADEQPKIRNIPIAQE